MLASQQIRQSEYTTSRSINTKFHTTMDNKKMGSEDLASPGIHGFKDWASKPSKETKDTPASRQPLDKQNPEDPVMAAHLCEVGTALLCTFSLQ